MVYYRKHRKLVLNRVLSSDKTIRQISKYPLRFYKGGELKAKIALSRINEYQHDICRIFQ